MHKQLIPFNTCVVIKVVVIGGSGYVGRQICQQAVVRGHFVTSVNLRGKPAALENEEWADKVTWLKADVFKPDEWDAVISADTTVVASVGALGSAETMYAFYYITCRSSILFHSESF